MWKKRETLTVWTLAEKRTRVVWCREKGMLAWGKKGMWKKPYQQHVAWWREGTLAACFKELGWLCEWRGSTPECWSRGLEFGLPLSKPKMKAESIVLSTRERYCWKVVHAWTNWKKLGRGSSNIMAQQSMLITHQYPWCTNAKIWAALENKPIRQTII